MYLATQPAVSSSKYGKQYLSWNTVPILLSFIRTAEISFGGRGLKTRTNTLYYLFVTFLDWLFFTIDIVEAGAFLVLPSFNLR